MAQPFADCKADHGDALLRNGNRQANMAEADRKRRGWVRAALKWAAIAVGLLVALPVLYLAIAVAGALVQSADGEGDGTPSVTIYLASNGFHADMILPAVTMSVIPMGIVARTVRALVADILSQEFVVGLRAKGLTDWGVFAHVVKNAAPTALAVMGLQLGYLLGGSILIETVFSWPGTGSLLNAAIFQRDLPLLQGTILVLALFFVVLNLLVDVVQTALDPRIQRG